MSSLVLSSRVACTLARSLCVGRLSSSTLTWRAALSYLSYSSKIALFNYSTSSLLLANALL
jgi:hypothetical protein